MKAFVVAVALLAACHRGDRTDAGAGSASAPVLPHVLFTEDGVAEMAKLDKKIELSVRPAEKLALVMTRATMRGRLEDYQLADRLSDELVKTAVPDDQQTAWAMRVRALAAIHEFTAARAALEQVKKRALDDSQWTDLATSLDESAGPRDRSSRERAAGAKRAPNALSVTLYAASLAFEGRFDDAIAQIPRANALLRDNTPETVAWLLFQWGRLHEQKGELATARAFYQEAHDRLPSYVEATSHLGQIEIQLGDVAAAKALVNTALVADRHPALLDLAAQLGLGSVDDARAAWERYVTALPNAFSDHAARFYLGIGKDPTRALALARANLANRDVPEARELAIQAALAAGDLQTACVLAGPLANSTQRRLQFAAWQAFSQCNRTEDAERIARRLGL